MFIPLLIFLNRFLLPDMSFDSINYHIFTGGRVWNFWKFSSIEFYPTGIHSFPPVFDYLGGIFRSMLGYRLGSICSLLFLYGIIFILIKATNLFVKQKIFSNILLVLFFINIFISLEAFFQIGTYYVDIIGAFFILWSLYLWFLYLKGEKSKYLYLSGLLMGIAVSGKLTNLIFAIPMFILICIFECQKSETLKLKTNKILLFVILLLIPISVSCVGNFLKTNNPLFPFYNSIFKSKYFPPVSFENTNYGGRYFTEKLLWPIYSLKNIGRLGEGHDLFNDYKLNLYFGLAIPSLIIAFRQRKKDKILWVLNLYYFLSIFIWNFSFGYLRYAYVLEILGGFILLIWISKIINQNIIKVNKAIFALILVLLLIFGYLDKRAINLNLAYDVSWRQTFIYNRLDYIKEYKNLFVSKLDNIIVEEEFKPDVFLNCSSPGLSFYSLSQFNTLPVINIDSRASGEMTNNYYYRQEVEKRINKWLGNKKQVKFVTIVGNHGLSNQYQDCMGNLKSRGYFVTKQISVDNFLGYSGQKLVYIFGEY